MQFITCKLESVENLKVKSNLGDSGFEMVNAISLKK